ncbi:uncharacterized protein PpBr36_06591 [Pyricularia pennisetigena]|uniref:uncharacterized protein n=1 Tax=Pyricularia pennisetigena TaxID=1578925 RepID=UPI0011501806|nr:uncharacterized protein PpBr36_06591 [Pyricularia pennisetigena]TLS22933.1 hypothetical protein PpBr36_06591 [Pyricularia pennisetigena]
MDDKTGDKGGSAPPAKKQRTGVFGCKQLQTSGTAIRSPSLTQTTSSNPFVSHNSGLPAKASNIIANQFAPKDSGIPNKETTTAANPLISPESITIDSDGNLYLEVRQSHIFQVDSYTLCRHSTVFKAMLTGPWFENQSKEGKWTVKLPEDSPRGLEVLLNIVHGRFDLVPTDLEDDYLLDVCVEADNRDMVKESSSMAAEELRQGLAKLAQNPPCALTELQEKHFEERAKLLGTYSPE